MGKKRAWIVTPWALEADDTRPVPSNHPAIEDAYDIGLWEDVTGQDINIIPPSPNEYTICCHAIEEDVLSAIDADDDYEVLQSEDL